MNDSASQHPYIFAVRMNEQPKTHSFQSADDHYAVDDHVVVETDRGLLLGTIASHARPHPNTESELSLPTILRKAEHQDLRVHQENLDRGKDAHQVCQELIRKYRLNMNLVSSDYTLDQSRVTFMYVAEERVDFRDLLRELSSRLKTRIELKQVGPRDKAKMVGGIGTCGQETCCSRHLQHFDVISINMAKNQNLALNTQKLSGLCGKLMCCLRYENDAYKELREGCPKLHESIEYEGKRMRVSSMNLITQQARLENREESLTLPFVEAFREYRRQEALKHEAAKELSE